MIYISNLGNIHGSDSDKENHPDYLKEALKQGYHIKVDVYIIHNQIILGQDKPQYEIDKLFLSNNRIWVQAQNIETLHVFASSGNLIHYFFHDTDDMALTSKGWIWTHYGKTIGHPKSVAVMPERLKIIPPNLYSSGAICSDFPEKYKTLNIGK